MLFKSPSVCIPVFILEIEEVQMRFVPSDGSIMLGVIAQHAVLCLMNSPFTKNCILICPKVKVQILITSIRPMRKDCVIISYETYAETKSEIQEGFRSNDVTKKESRVEISGQNENAENVSTKLVDVNKTHSSVSNKRTLISCILNGSDIKTSVEIVNITRLSQVLQLEHNVTHKGIPGHCVAVLFYSQSCPFSCMAAPHFNALPRFFPDIRMVAIDAILNRNYNSHYGVIGTPTLMLFHSGRPAVKFNETSEYGLEVFSNFITKHTGIKPVGRLVVTSADFRGPLPSTPVKETDYYLTLSWMVIAARILYSLYYSTWGRSFTDATLNAWREAEAQHHHVD